MSKQQISWLAVTFILVLSVSLLINIPIRHILHFIELPKELNLQGLKGNIRHTSIEQLSYQNYQLNNVGIKLDSSCFFRLNLCYIIDSGDYDLSGRIEASTLTQIVKIKDALVTIQSEQLVEFVNLLIKPVGTFNLKVEELSLQYQKITHVNMQIDWENAGIEGEDQVLGDYVALIKSQDSGLRLDLSDRDSLLSAKGSVEVLRNGAFEADISLKSASSLKPSIKSAVSLMAKQTGLDQFSYKNKGRLPANTLKLLELLKTSK